jgi:geranylgeranyl pyrophosphate synthase
VRHAFTNDSASDAEVEAALSAIRSGDVIPRVRALATEHVESALERIGGLPESIFSQRLADLAGGLVTRVS